CGNLTAAVGSFAISSGLVDAERIPENGICVVRIWQANIKKTIIAHVPITNGEVQETGDFELDGVTFPAAEVTIEFVEPVSGDTPMFPTGNLVDDLEVPGIGTFKASMIAAGIPTIFLNTDEIPNMQGNGTDGAFNGTELQTNINGDTKALEMFERIRAYGAIKMGLITDIEEAKTRQHTPKIAFVAPAKSYTSSSGKDISESDIDLNVRALSMGLLHHAMMGTAAVAIATASAIPGTLVNLAAGGGSRESVRFGHPSGALKVGAEVAEVDGQWKAKKVIMSRSARILMEGNIRVPFE
ncbi:MAG: 2-methylaconitate cis-trans isomerase PrpF, partial [Gammaproteobacteria bacterium]|nr:2-methylaconitate cis-trans isomerase PrpF [Gammaproteobacteria bacterium]